MLLRFICGMAVRAALPRPFRRQATHLYRPLGLGHSPSVRSPHRSDPRVPGWRGAGLAASAREGVAATRAAARPCLCCFRRVHTRTAWRAELATVTRGENTCATAAERALRQEVRRCRGVPNVAHGPGPIRSLGLRSCGSSGRSRRTPRRPWHARARRGAPQGRPRGLTRGRSAPRSRPCRACRRPGARRRRADARSRRPRSRRTGARTRARPWPSGS